MDGKKFDDLIRSINESRVTRRKGLRGMIAGAATVIAGAGISRVSEPAAAQDLCPVGHTELCHNATAENGGNIICPNSSSATLQGHCNHTGPGNPVDCACEGQVLPPGCNLPTCDECEPNFCILIVTPTTTTTTAAPTTTTTTAAPTTT